MFSRDQIEGCLIGAAIGDALGAPHEMKWMPQNYTGKLEYTWTRRFKWGINVGNEKVFALTSAVGQYTDDMEMLLTLTRSLLQNQGYDKNKTILAYLEWANIPRNHSIGNNTRRLFKGVKTLKGYQNRIKKYYSTQKERNAIQSNGALMRCAPLAFLDDYSEIVKTDTEITNPNDWAIQSSLYHTSLIRFSLESQKETIVKRLLDKFPLLKVPINEALQKRTRDLKTNQGWCLHGVYISTWCYLYFDRFDQAMAWLYSLKGDMDTNMCIAGSLMGAKLGLEKMLQEDKTKFNYERVLEWRGDSGDFPRAEKYLMGDYKTLAKGLLALNKKD